MGDNSTTIIGDNSTTIIGDNSTTIIGDNSDFITFLNDSLWYNDTVFFDEPGSCFDMDCIWNRARRERLHILRPLTFLLSIIGILGIVGNIFVIIVYYRATQKQTSTYLVMMLSIMDLIACGLVIPGTLMKEWFMKFKSDIVCKLAELTRNFIIISSAMILAAIAFDRFLLVHRKYINKGNKKIMMIISLIIILTGIILGVPPMLGVGVYMKQSDGDVGLLNVKVCLPNELLISEHDLQVYWKVITALFGLLILTIIIIYMLIFIKVYTHIHMNKVGMHTEMSKQKSASKSFLPFEGLSPSTRRTTSKINRNANNLSIQRRLPAQTPPRPSPLRTLHRLFQKHKPKLGNQVVTVNIISNTSTSDMPAPKPCNGNFHPSPTWIGTRAPVPGPSNCLGRNEVQSQSNLKLPKSPSSTASTKHSLLQQPKFPLRNHRAHIKTTQVLCIITSVYIVAFLPMFLVTHGVVEQNEIIFYLYFINNAANPIIYSFMNRKFRQDIWKLFTNKKCCVRAIP